MQSAAHCAATIHHATNRGLPTAKLGRSLIIAGNLSGTCCQGYMRCATFKSASSTLRLLS